MIARVAVSVILAGALVTCTAGCTFFARQTTQEVYDPSDGVSVTIGEVRVNNALAITGDGETANLIIQLSNMDEKTRKILLQYESDGERRDITQIVSANDSVSFGTEEAGPLLLTGLDVEIGGLLPVFVQYGDQTGQTMYVPVLDGSLPEYQEFVPEQAEESE